ncbi:MAG: F0F1 ATP synthase subunit alpha [Candidatus Spechtbacteria bacterium SB0662_bin_43]|uniref:ATP synthase subunit alpha n=1 Tax=Candidatus Spechtbacteria bacterium SB0662_bin_43 TaxID=2604897 RepID=A0A845DL99_9BACT|nr:F0F1 ATP synthase subunit alpha [Candidatus Spechtbacteria bacterium SB0662_bin_43]
MSDFIIEQLKKELSGITGIATESIGTIERITDGIATISGLDNVRANEMVALYPETAGTAPENIPNDNVLFGMALNLKEQQVDVVILGDAHQLRVGDTAKTTERVLEVPVGDELVGHIIDPLGISLEGKSIGASQTSPIEKDAPSVLERKSVHEPLQTGIKAIDAMIPIGRGQRELIIGDKQIGKTTLIIDTILSQLNEPQESRPICIYVAIGQKASRVARIAETLRSRNAMAYTIIVSAPASVSPAVQYIAPYTGATLGEYFRDNGRHAVVFYDDLTKHAWAYRELSLLLRRPPGREAYPGDVFYLHSRLLERAAKLSDEKGGGSLTAIPVIETQAGDVSSYIPTNVISITDGQIYLEPDLFYKGLRPALNVGLSVSRVGSSAQTKAMKSVAGTLRLELAQYRELASFAQFGSDLDQETQDRLKRGEQLSELLKQPLNKPLPWYAQVLVLYAGINGLIDDIPTNTIQQWEKQFIEYASGVGKPVQNELQQKGAIDQNLEAKIKTLIQEFNQTFLQNAH